MSLGQNFMGVLSQGLGVAGQIVQGELSADRRADDLRYAQVQATAQSERARLIREDQNRQYVFYAALGLGALFIFKSIG